MSFMNDCNRIADELRKQKAVKRAGKRAPADLSDEVRCFDKLPDIARVRLPTVATLFGVSQVTVWRWVKEGVIPQPKKFGGATSWNVGELRKALAG